jgi:signal transduction histidine kinase
MAEPAPDRAPWADVLAEGIVWVEHGRITALNAAACRFLHTEAARAIGLPPISVVRDHRIESALADGVAFDLHTRGLRLEVLPFEGGFALRDTTEARRAAENARALLAVLSHELRTPVTTVLASLEALQFDLPEAQRTRYLTRALEEAGRLVRLLEDLTVDVAPPRARSVRLVEAAERVAALLDELLRERGVRLTTELPVHATAWVDPDKFVQALLNLVENAAIHGPADAEVTLAARQDPQRSGWWRLEVLDRGAPVEPAAMEAWFAPNARGASATVRGTGLGLYIVRSIATRWGGEAWARRWERGNAFGISVPKERP